MACETKQFSDNQVSNVVWISNNSVCLQSLYTYVRKNMVKGIISYSLFSELCNDFTCINVHILYNNQVIMYICSYTTSYKYIVNS